MKEFLNFNCEKFINSLSPTANKNYWLWAATKYLKKPKQLKFPISEPDKTWANTDAEKAEIFADHFKTAIQPHRDLETLADSEFLPVAPT